MINQCRKFLLTATATTALITETEMMTHTKKKQPYYMRCSCMMYVCMFSVSICVCFFVCLRCNKHYTNCASSFFFSFLNALQSFFTSKKKRNKK